MTIIEHRVTPGQDFGVRVLVDLGHRLFECFNQIALFEKFIGSEQGQELSQQIQSILDRFIGDESGNFFGEYQQTAFKISVYHVKLNHLFDRIFDLIRASAPD